MMRRRSSLVLLALALLVALWAAGCAPNAPNEPELTPTIAPPLIGEAGVLRAGVDLGYPPFAGEDQGQQAGIDVDVAAALAERFGLKLELVDLSPAEVGAALADGEVDIALGGLTVAEAVNADAAFAGSYLIDGPGFFSLEATGSAVATGTPAFDPATGVGTARVGAQKESAAYWSLESEYGEGFTVGYSTLREALEALTEGEVDVVAGDAAIGAYLARDFPGVVFAGQYGAATPVGVLVDKDATDLEAEVRDMLDALATDGVLETIRTKWLGVLPVLEAGSGEAGAGT